MTSGAGRAGSPGPRTPSNSMHLSQLRIERYPKSPSDSATWSVKGVVFAPKSDEKRRPGGQF
jgi:hypothetical protein